MKAWARKINVSGLCSSSSQKAVSEALVQPNAFLRLFKPPRSARSKAWIGMWSRVSQARNDKVLRNATGRCRTCCTFALSLTSNLKQVRSAASTKHLHLDSDRFQKPLWCALTSFMSLLPWQRRLLSCYCQCSWKRLKGTKKNRFLVVVWPLTTKTMNVLNNNNSNISTVLYTRALDRFGFGTGKLYGEKIGGRCQVLRSAGEMRQAHTPLGAIRKPMKKEIKCFCARLVQCTNSKFVPSQMSSWGPQQSFIKEDIKLLSWLCWNRGDLQHSFYERATAREGKAKHLHEV